MQSVVTVECWRILGVDAVGGPLFIDVNEIVTAVLRVDGNLELASKDVGVAKYIHYRVDMDKQRETWIKLLLSGAWTNIVIEEGSASLNAVDFYVRKNKITCEILKTPKRTKCVIRYLDEPETCIFYDSCLVKEEHGTIVIKNSSTAPDGVEIVEKF